MDGSGSHGGSIFVSSRNKETKSGGLVEMESIQMFYFL